MMPMDIIHQFSLKLKELLFDAKGTCSDGLENCRREICVLDDYNELKKVFGWELDPIIDDQDLLKYRFAEDVNNRRLRDFESIATVVKNVAPEICLDIGTGSGSVAALMSINAPDAEVNTVNIPPEEFEDGGTLTTIKLKRDEIGSYYKRRGLAGINQIFANTKNWNPNFKKIDVAFIDGSHDIEFVVNDTMKIIKSMPPGSFILWHDFNLSLVNNYHWIKSVCLGVEQLYRNGVIKGRIFSIKNSWIGIYQVPSL
ncbi:Methyltransferase domain-containing protein [Candidatus Electrothrix aarhusensis]|uniref:Methyltransferase domain-containing protein n=1 Tax=Candidatus Electrothrix aarhusensis TaxID=1859131 RepID=A0A444J0S8_9BACT|nr:Methyltransferase domain-containing protein [Candidatus Electrothrix aarhusensis]